MLHIAGGIVIAYVIIHAFWIIIARLIIAHEDRDVRMAAAKARYERQWRDKQATAALQAVRNADVQREAELTRAAANTNWANKRAGFFR